MRAPRILVLGVVGTVALGAISAGTATSSSSAPRPTPAAATVSSLLTHPGKIMAGNCFQCHGTDGINGTFGSLAGESASELYNELKELQTETDADEAIMRVHANAYTDDQLRLIADYFSKVPSGGGR